MQSNRTTPSRAAGVGTTVSLLLLGILLTLAALYFCVTHLRPTIEADLTARVTESLDSAGIENASVTVEGQDVTLRGDVADNATRTRAEQLSTEVYGVSRVFSQLTVGGAERPSGQTATEAALATSEKPKLILEPVAPAEPATTAVAGSGNEDELSPSTLDIRVQDGFVTAQGIVPDEASIERINSALSGKFGRANVEDDMSTYDGSADPVWLDAAIFLVDQMDNIDNPSLKITQNSAIVGGMVSSETMGTQKSALAERLLGPYLNVTSEFTLSSKDSKLPAPEARPRTIKKRPASLKIRSVDGEVQMTGTVSTTSEAETLRNGMNTMFNSGFTDKLIIDDSVAESDWLNEAIAVTDNVKSIDNFSVSINSGQLLLSGEIDDRLFGRTLASATAEITGDKLNVVNNFAALKTQPIAVSGEELLAKEMIKDLNALDTSAIVFNKGKTTLTADAMKVLDQAATIILSYRGLVVEIAGHTDSSGDALANLELSKKRAIAVRDYLIEKQVPDNRLRPIGYGETKPVADNKTSEGQAANRRIEFNL